MRFLVAAVAFSLALSPATALRADETSATDKLRILYSTRFTFTDDGVPLVTVQILGGRKEVKLRAKGGLSVRPDGQGGATIDTDSTDTWTLTAENTKPAVIHDWTVVATLDPDDATGISTSLATWKQRGFDPRAFDIGTVFGTGGEVIDTREVRIAIDPVPSGKGVARAADHAKRYGVPTSTHQELVRRPAGTIIARSGSTTIKNPSVIWFTPRRGATETITVSDVPTNAGGSQLDTGTEDRRYWGAVYITLDHDGTLVAANAVAEDKLLAGLVPAEMYADAPPEALQAQAIAARTELLQKIGRRNLTDPFLLCSTQQCQVYAGAGKEDPRTTKAVEKTRGMVLLRDGGGLVDIRYSASCGGHTEDNDVIWGGDADPSLRGRTDDSKANVSRVTEDNLDAFLASNPKDSYCGRTRLGATRFRWTVALSLDDLTTRLAPTHPEIGRVRSIAALKRGSSGRIMVLAVKGTKSTVELTGDLNIRRLLGGLKSTLFDIDEPKDGKVTLRGAGFGHGVGMCQMGAIGMAEAGKVHAEILKHYYRGTHVHKLY